MSLRLPLARRQLDAPWWAVALALAAAALFIQLGRWQWHRAAYKQQLIGQFAGEATRLRDVAGAEVDGLPRYAHVRLHGHFDGSRQMLLDNLSRDGVAGYEVLTPFQADDGQWLLVNRGWLAMPEGRRDGMPAIGLGANGADTGAATAIDARTDHLPVTGLERGRSAPEAMPGAAEGWPKRASFPTMGDLGAALATPLPRWQLLLAANLPDGYRRDWQPTAQGFGPERHLAYAIQWWGFAALSLIVLVVVNSRKKS